MFEKEARKYAEAFLYKGVAEASFIKGAEFGYNKANEWHFVKDGKYPKDEKDVELYLKRKKPKLKFLNFQQKFTPKIKKDKTI